MINNIQSLRFFAAMAVFMVHVAPRYKSMTPSMEVFDYFTLFGQSGVDIFFVISGYIMWHSTRKLHGCMDSTFFAMNRLARIFTGYWPFFILYFVYLFYLNIDALVDVDMLKSFFLIPQSRNKNLIGVTWTLFFELYFYLFMAFLVLTTREKALRILIFVGLFFLFLNIYKYLTMSNAELANFSYFQFLTSPYIVEFIAGCFAWELIKRETFSSYRSFVILGLLLILFGAWFNYEIMDRTIFHGYHRLYRVAIFGTAAFFLVYGLVGLEKQGHTLKHKLWIDLGNSSYALYLSHSLFLLIFALYIKPFLNGSSASLIWLVGLGWILTTVIYNLVHFKLVEEPLHKGAKQLIKRLRPKSKV